MKETVDIIGDLVSQLEFTETILDCEVLPDNEVKLTLCSTHGLVSKGCFFIGAVEYKAKEVIGGKYIIFTGNSCPLETEIFIPAPNYFYGTVKATNSELTQIKKAKQKTPLVYYYHVSKEKRNRNPEINLGRRADIILFFLEDDAVKGELTEDRHREYVAPMTQLAEDFVDLLESSSIIGDIEEEEYTIISQSKAGFYDRVGHVKNLFSMELSGIEFRISLPINKNGCEDCKH
jgi:hypothetical protein